MLESQDHLRAKERIRDIARKKGLIAENEVPFCSWSCYHGRGLWYSADIFICSNDGRTNAVVEIYGYKGHSSRYQTRRDERRRQDIKAVWGDNIVFRHYTIKELENATDEEIEKDLGIE